jgi:peptidoglycan biosynthesis protein MviN/MurJ (putative lipid II flippase)
MVFGLPLPAMGFLGLALATAVASWLNFVLLAMSFARRTAQPWHPGGLAVYGRIAAASLTMGACALLTYYVAQEILPVSGTLGLALQLGLAIFSGMIVILPLLRWCNVEEEKELSAIVIRLVRKVL